MNSIKTDNSLSNLMWCTESEEKILHYINGNIYFGDSYTEVVIYELVQGVEVPVHIAKSVRAAGRWIGIGTKGGLVVEDGKGRLNEDEYIQHNNKIYRCAYYYNLEIEDQMAADRACKRTKLIYTHKMITQDLIDKRKRKAEAKKKKNKIEFDNYSNVVGSRWKSITGVALEFNFKSDVLFENLKDAA